VFESFYYFFLWAVVTIVPLLPTLLAKTKIGTMIIVALSWGYIVLSVFIAFVFLPAFVFSLFNVLNIGLLIGLVVANIVIIPNIRFLKGGKHNARNVIFVIVMLQALLFVIAIGAFAFFVPIVATPTSKKPQLIFWGYSTDDLVIQKCADYGIGMTINVYQSDFYPASPKSNDIRKLAENNVSIVININPSYGFADMTNAKELFGVYQNFSNWYFGEGFTIDNVSRVSIDSECSIDFFNGVMAKYSSLNVIGILRTISENIPSDEVINTTSVYRELLAEEIGADGFISTIVCLPTALNDISDGDSDMQHTLLEYSLPAESWDEVAFMSYRVNVLPEFGIPAHWLMEAGMILPDYSVYYYSRMADVYNDSGSIPEASMFLGEVGSSPYDSMSEIVKDINIVRSFDYDRVWLFWINSFLDKFGLGGFDDLIAGLDDTTPVSMSFANPSYRIFTNMLLVYYALDAFYPLLKIKI
jgi:hypothetical protein